MGLEYKPSLLSPRLIDPPVSPPKFAMSASSFPSCTESAPLAFRVERRPDGAIVVRVPSTGQFGEQLPDAVFSFRIGEPQYGRWARQIEAQTVSQR